MKPFRSRRRVPPPPRIDAEAEERENARIKADSVNRMQVFDEAPKYVRDRVNQMGEKPLQDWFGSLSVREQHRVLRIPYTPMDSIFDW